MLRMHALSLKVSGQIHSPRNELEAGGQETPVHGTRSHGSLGGAFQQH